jgi:hypothetical protein
MEQTYAIKRFYSYRERYSSLDVPESAVYNLYAVR